MAQLQATEGLFLVNRAEIIVAATIGDRETLIGEIIGNMTANDENKLPFVLIVDSNGL